jgi:spermidine synthase
MQQLSRLPAASTQSITGGEGAWTWLGRYWGEIDISHHGPVQDEWLPQIEFYLPKIRYHEDFSLVNMLSWLISIRPHLNDAAKQLGIQQGTFAQFEKSYIATELAYRAWLSLFENKSGQELRLFKLAYEANPKDRWVGFALADRMFASIDNSGLDRRKALGAVLKVRHDHVEALEAMWRLEQEDGNKQAAQRYLARLKAVDPLNSLFHE